MEFKSVTVNNCYILKDEVFNNFFFSNIEAYAVYSASVFHLAFFKKDIPDISQDILEKYEKLSIDLYKLNSPYLNIPFEINFHENKLYQAYYESDHFPLSLWIEEKVLIPFDIFLRILEDILYALRDLDKSGHSHMFLTPEEILVPLQWDNKKHAKLNNVGINSLVSIMMSEKEILEYRSIYHKKGNKPVETALIKNISDDLFSFGNIMSRLLLICDSTIGDKKAAIRKKLDKIINQPDKFKTIEEVIYLFKEIFIKEIKFHTLPEEPDSISYSGRATFDIPQFNEWHEEAELEPLLEELNSDDDNIPEPVIKKQSIYNSVASFFSRLFSRKAKPTSKTLEDFSNSVLTKLNKPPDKNIGSIPDSTITGDMGNRTAGEDRENIVNQLKNHYIEPNGNNNKSDNISPQKDLNNEIRDYSNAGKVINNIPSHITQRDSSSYIKSDDKDSSPEIIVKKNKDKSRVNIDLNAALASRDYQRGYDIIKNTINGSLDSEISMNLSELNNILDNKLKELDEHYITNKSTDILTKLEDLKEKQIILETDQEEIKQIINISELEKAETKEEVNFFLKILLYLKRVYQKLTTKK